MKTYEVRYKKIGDWFYKKITKCKGDGFVENQVSGNSIISFKDIRWFILENEERIEISTKNMIFKFNRDRFYSIKDRMETESGVDLKIDKK